MKDNKRSCAIILKKGIQVCTFFVMLLLFNICFNIEVYAYPFKYSEFDFDSFATDSKNYWYNECEEDDEECYDAAIKEAEKFYTKMYKILAKYEKKGLFVPGSDEYEYIDDLILETIFFELTPDHLTDTGENYNDFYDVDNKAYAIDETDLDDPDVDVDYDSEEDATYYETESDTLKILIKNLIGYTTSCYGIYGDPVTHTTDTGETYTSCDNGGDKLDVSGSTKCVTLIDNYNLGFWKYYVSKFTHGNKFLNKTIPFLGRTVEDENYELCEGNAEDYAEGTTYVYKDDPHVSTDVYFDFLINNTYFDGKAHLQYRYKETILEPAGVECMMSSVCDNSLEEKINAGEIEEDEYEAAAIEVREEIVNDIIGILNDYGFEDIAYDGTSDSSYTTVDTATAARNSFYWPIGSDETEERNGVTYADGDPASTNVISKYGTRTNPVTGEVEEHYGIDISGVENKTNVIAVYRGTVVSIVDTCVSGDTTCNEGYGNTIILSHSNGDYTVYAHLGSIDESVTVGSTVDKGQLIGKVGLTGSVTEACLHFELRTGGNDVTNAENPLNALSTEDPRPTVASGDFSTHETSLTKEEFVSKLESYCKKKSCSSALKSAFVNNAALVYEVSVANNVNPELVVARGMVEGMSPGDSNGSYNYWGIGCTNTGGLKDCHKYSSLSEGIKAFANVSSVKNNETAVGMMSTYAYIGDYWYNPGSSGGGGCYYYNSIKEYLSTSRAEEVKKICSGAKCSKENTKNCTKTTDEDQTAYATYQVKEMATHRSNIFGL